VIDLMLSRLGSLTLTYSASLYTDTNKTRKYLEVQKSNAQLDITDKRVRISKQSINVPIPFPTSALNLLENLKFAI
jgi:hypothetical protein